MPYEHNLPAVINPSGDIVVPLCIPHDADYTALLLGVLRTLEEVERYERDPDYDDTSAQIVAGNFRDRTITPLIDSIANGVGMPQAYRLNTKPIGSNFSSSSLTFVVVTNSGFLHTFTYPNAKIRCHNISVVNSSGSESVLGVPRINGMTSVQNGMFENVGLVQRPLTAIAEFSGIAVGVSKTIELIIQVTGGTATINANSHLLYEIEEWP